MKASRQRNFLRGSYRFRPQERLRTSSEYQRVRKAGKRFRTRHFWVNFAANNLPYHRLGIVVQKRFNNATTRNRIKRCLREWFRLHKGQIPSPAKDIVVVARPGAGKLSLRQMADELLAVFDKQDGRST